MQQLAQGYGLSVWNWVGQGGAASPDVNGMVCGAVSLGPSVLGLVSIGPSVTGLVVIQASVGGVVDVSECC